MTIAGFGSLLSERSARTTFPALRNFRLGRVRGFRRVFAHRCGGWVGAVGVWAWVGGWVGGRRVHGEEGNSPPSLLTLLLPGAAEIFYERGIARPETGEVSACCWRGRLP